MNFDLAFDRLIGNEGGISNNPDDPGRLTNWGISQRSYPQLNIRALTREDAKAIYRRDYWDRARMDQYPPVIAFQVFDIAVNSGIEAAVRMLQRAVGVEDDGDIGPVTLAAIRARNTANVVMRLIAERLDFWRHLPTWPKFGDGWAGRAANDLRYGAEDL